MTTYDKLSPTGNDCCPVGTPDATLGTGVTTRARWSKLFLRDCGKEDTGDRGGSGGGTNGGSAGGTSGGIGGG